MALRHLFVEFDEQPLARRRWTGPSSDAAEWREVVVKVRGRGARRHQGRHGDARFGLPRWRTSAPIRSAVWVAVFWAVPLVAGRGAGLREARRANLPTFRADQGL